MKNVVFDLGAVVVDWNPDRLLREYPGDIALPVTLFEKGFSKEAIDKVSNEFFVDFSAICRKRIEKMGGLSIFSDKDEKKKAVSALLRYGFSYDDIKDAIKKKP